MSLHIDRRNLLKLAGIGGAVYASGLGPVFAHPGSAEDFLFVQLTDTHWGYSGPANPEAANTLQRAVAAVNALERQPDFIVFTGDLTQTTDDEAERRRRMAQFKDIVSALRVRDIRFMPGEHDAALDRGAVYRDFFGPSHYSFDHKGVHFVALDNVSDPGAKLGDEQLAWLAADLAGHDRAQPLVVLAHRPLFDLYPEWDWATADGARALDILMPHRNVVVFYGHIHQEHHYSTGHIVHHAGTSLIFPQPAPGSQPRRTPVAWDAAHPFRGLGFRVVGEQAGAPHLDEHGIG